MTDLNDRPQVNVDLNFYWPIPHPAEVGHAIRDLLAREGAVQFRGELGRSKPIEVTVRFENAADWEASLDDSVEQLTFRLSDSKGYVKAEFSSLEHSVHVTGSFEEGNGHVCAGVIETLTDVLKLKRRPQRWLRPEIRGNFVLQPGQNVEWLGQSIVFVQNHLGHIVRFFGDVQFSTAPHVTEKMSELAAWQSAVVARWDEIVECGCSITAEAECHIRYRRERREVEVVIGAKADEDLRDVLKQYEKFVCIAPASGRVPGSALVGEKRRYFIENDFTPEVNP